jgi:hypothetical protein
MCPFTFHITQARSFFHILVTGLKLTIINTFSMAKFTTNHAQMLCLDYQLLLWPQLIPHMRTVCFNYKDESLQDISINVH